MARSRDWTIAAINDCFAVRFAATTFRGHLLVERIIKQNDLARDFLARQRFQFIKISDHNYFCFNSIRGRRHAWPERTQDNLLRGIRCLSGKLNERCCFFTAHPVRHRHFFELHFAADDFQFAGDVLDGFGRLCRPGQTWPDIVR